jgi:hypothetical protein
VSHHVLAIAESDSYLKWAVSLFAQPPAPTLTHLAVACSPIRPSPDQRKAALAETAFAGHDPEVVSPAQFARTVQQTRPDAVLLACTGPTAHAYQEALSRVTHRPVLLSGIPGIALPARRRAWGYRGAVDLFVVHSHREVQEYERVRVMTGKSGRVALATIPFLSPAGTAEAGRPQAPTRRSNRVLFATQGKVPRLRRERLDILMALDRLAAARPDLAVVVKTRGVPGEFHTHHEPHHYADLWHELVVTGRVHDPQALQFVAGSMAEQLRDAAALLTVSSTAVLEAMALNLPVLLIDEFGVSESLINQVFVGSNCLGDLSSVQAADFRAPARWWLSDNYFHPPEQNTWTSMLDELVDAARAGQLPPIAAGLDPGRSPRRRRRDRLRLTPAGSALVRTRRRVRTRMQPDALARRG